MGFGWRRRDDDTTEGALIRHGESAFEVLTLPRHPFQIYILILATFSGLPLLFGYVPSGGIEEQLNPFFVKVWGFMLLAGSVLSLVGVYWPWRKDTALIQERTGLYGLGLSSVIYSATAIFSVGGFSAWFAGCITAGFGFACFAQIKRINPIVRAIVQAAEHEREQR